MTLIIDELTLKDKFKTIKESWDRLLEKSYNPSLFLSHEWFESCINSYSTKKNLLILLIKDRAELIGIAPFWQYHDVIRKVPVSKLEFITSHDTPFVDFIIKKERQEEVNKAIVHHLLTERKNDA